MFPTPNKHRGGASLGPFALVWQSEVSWHEHEVGCAGTRMEKTLVTRRRSWESDARPERDPLCDMTEGRNKRIESGGLSEAEESRMEAECSEKVRRGLRARG